MRCNHHKTPDPGRIPMRPLLQCIASEMAKGFAEAEDTVWCPTHKERRKSLGQAVQREVDETCVYVCAECGAVCDDLPF